MQGTFSHYRVLEEIGSGGMGVVYRGRDQHLDCDVAIKVLPPGKLSDAVARRRFRNEALALSRIHHPNIAVVHDFDTQDGVDFLVQELIPGRSLREVLQHGPLPPGQIVQLGVQLCEGLAAAHEQGIIHRDLKPENIRVTPRAQLKILDFGLARVTDSRVPLSGDACDTQTLTSLAGTLPYMAPEQVMGLAVDGRTDIWAAGIVLYEMATGARPFAGEPKAVMTGILNTDPKPLAADGAGSAKLSAIILRCLSKDAGERYQSAEQLAAELKRLEHAPVVTAARAGRWQRWVAVGVLATFLAAEAAWLRVPRAGVPAPLDAGESVVLADFSNTTGDAVFDDALKQGLALQLRQSPAFEIVSERQVANTLRQMGRGNDAVTNATAREVCLRTNSKVLVEGSVARLGSRYVVGVRATTCSTGELLHQAQQQVGRKEEVLDALSSMTTGLRARLGESIGSIQQLDVPLAEATTTSLDALQAFSVGMKHIAKLEFEASVADFERAIALDPRFALAYARLAQAYDNLGDQQKAMLYAGKAFELRGKVTEPEKLYIEGRYYLNGTEDYENAIRTYRVWKETYPRATVPYNNLGVIYRVLGQWEQAVPEAEEYARRVPNVFAYSVLISDYVYVDRLPQAQGALEAARKRGLNMDELAPYAYKVAFARGDEQEMRRLLATAGNVPDNEFVLLDMDALTHVYHGQLAAGIDLNRRAAAAAMRAGHADGDLAAKVEVALWQAELRGGDPQLRRNLRHWLRDPRILENERIAMLALARAGDAAHARALANGLPARPLLRLYWKPTILAAAALAENKPEEALRLLGPVAPYELCAGGATEAGPYAIYLRGEAYLRLKDGPRAAAEFQKIVQHRGITLYSHLGPLAHVQLARAYAIGGARAPARAEYERFFGLWAKADPSLPLAREAREEYAQMR